MMLDEPQEPEIRRQGLQRQSARLMGRIESGKSTVMVNLRQAQVEVTAVVMLDVGVGDPKMIIKMVRQ